MSLALNDLPRDPDWLLRQLQQMTEVVVIERSRNTARICQEFRVWAGG
jgi:hypothetical protein